MNRKQRRDVQYKRGLSRAKKHVDNWECPGCGHKYKLIFVQSSRQPYLFCFEGCEEFFNLKGENVTKRAYPAGKPF